jgi:hypothetical protein
MSAESAQETLHQAERRLLRGIELVNDLMGLSIPFPPTDHKGLHAFVDPRSDGADRRFARLCATICGVPPNDFLDFEPLFRRYGDFLPDGIDFDDIVASVARLNESKQEDLVAYVKQLISFEETTLPMGWDGGSYTTVKINHGYWEFVARQAFARLGLSYFRKLDLYPNFLRSGFQHLLAASIRNVHKAMAAQGFSPGCFSAPGFVFQFGFSAGDAPNSNDLVVPLHPVVHGAILGAVSFLTTVVPAERYTLGDGFAAKALVYHGELCSFFERIKDCSDAIIFVVPDHLRNICVQDWSGQTYRIIVPATWIYALWPSVLPYAVASIAEIVDQCPRVTILVQAGAMSAPIGIAVDLMRRSRTRNAVRYFDLGQVLDLASLPDGTTGPWVRRGDIAEILSTLPRMPIYVG